MAHIPQVLPNSIPIPTAVISTFSFLWYYSKLILSFVPGGNYIIHYIRKSHQDDPYRTGVEALLIVYGIYYYFSKPQLKKSLQSSKPNLSGAEMDALIEEWQPEPIVDPTTSERQAWRLESVPIIHENGISTYINFTKNDKEYSKVLNLASNNFLQLSNEELVLDEVKKTIKNYGVGACGPAGFYGNEDVHYQCEYDMARFFGTEGAVLYGQDFCVASSVIPAFTKRGDVIVADDQISLSVQNALQLSRSTVYYFEHNNMESLDVLLRELTEAEKLENLPAIPRKFIVTEALFHNSGDLAPLPKLVELKKKYKFRLFMDETFSLGVLGEAGRGIAEHFQMDHADAIDITVGTMATAFGSSGAFVLGDETMSYHQHIGSNAYCFSASLPAYTVKSMSVMVNLLEKDNSKVVSLRSNARLVNEFFKNDSDLNNLITVTSNDFSPVVHFQLNSEFRMRKFNYSIEQLFEAMSEYQKKAVTTKFVEPYEDEEEFLQSIVDKLLENHNILITRNTFIIQHETLPIAPSLKICCNSVMDQQTLNKACINIKESILECCK